jgi:hypothetical protein
MKLNKENIIHTIESKLKFVLYSLYGWFVKDGEILGYILGIWHLMVCVAIFICVVISHTVYPFVWFQLSIFICLFIIWLQHIFLQVCVVFITEINLTNREPPFYTILREVIGFDLEKYSLYFLACETTAVGCFFLELLGKFSLYIRDNYIF